MLFYVYIPHQSPKPRDPHFLSPEKSGSIRPPFHLRDLPSLQALLALRSLSLLYVFGAEADLIFEHPSLFSALLTPPSRYGNYGNGSHPFLDSLRV